MRIFSTLEQFISMIELIGTNAVMDNPTNSDRVVIFDVDHCLYTSERLKVHESELKRQEFIRRKVLLENREDFTREKAESMVNENAREGKTFMELFCSQLSITPQEYYSEYDIFDYGEFIKKDERLIELIACLKRTHRLFVMTNSSDVRAKAILGALGLATYFEKVFCAIIIDQRSYIRESLSCTLPKSCGTGSPKIEPCSGHEKSSKLSQIGLVFKPSLEAYMAVYRFIGSKVPENIAFFDDSLVNIQASLKFGWNGVVVEQYKDKAVTSNRLIQELENYLERLNL